MEEYRKTDMHVYSGVDEVRMLEIYNNLSLEDLIHRRDIYVAQKKKGIKLEDIRIEVDAHIILLEDAIANKKKLK